MHWDYILLLAVLAVFVPWRSSSRVRALLDGPQISSSERIQLYLSTMAFQWLAAAVLVWRAEAHRLPLANLGIALPHLWRAVLVGAVVSLVLVLNQIFGLRRILALPAQQRGILPRLAEKLLPRSRVEMFVAVALVISVAICEEVIYRGFVQTVFQDALSNSVVGGAAVSSLFFSVAHLYQGRKGIVTTFVVGLIFSAARVWTGSLVSSVFIHFCVDLSAGIVAARFAKYESSAPPTLAVAFYGGSNKFEESIK
jgi:membrane protease YdiL (CAAX protease family)